VTFTKEQAEWVKALMEENSFNSSINSAFVINKGSFVSELAKYTI
jgi:hypothetical protein